MTLVKVVKIENQSIIFNDGSKLYSDHDQDCCESHELCLEDLTLNDFEGLEFNLDSEGKFFNRIVNYGIELLPVKGHSVKIAGHGRNNGYYSSNLILIIQNNEEITSFDISECQDIID